MPTSDLQQLLKLARLFKRRRETLGLKLVQVAAATGISASQINRLEDGAISKPSWFQMLRLIDFYGLSLTDILADAASPQKSDEGEFLTLARIVAESATPEQLDYAMIFLRGLLQTRP